MNKQQLPAFYIVENKKLIELLKKEYHLE